LLNKRYKDRENIKKSVEATRHLDSRVSQTIKTAMPAHVSAISRALPRTGSE